MAITNAQQYQQLVNPPMKGNKRPGYRGDDAARSDAASGRDAGRADPSGGVDRTRTSDRQDYNTAIATGKNPLGLNLSKGPPPLTPEEKEFNRLNNLSFSERFKINSLKNLYDQKFGYKKATPSFLSALNIFNPALEVYDESDPDLDDYGMSGEDLTDTDRLAKAINKAQDTGNITQAEFESAFFGPEGKPTVDDRDGPSDPCKGPNPPAYCFVGIRSVEPEVEPEEDDEIINYRLMSKGGRAGLAGGGMPYEGGIMDLESARQMYGLGKLVKKVTRSVKKIAKSPLGKAAIGAALFKFGSPFIKSDAFKNFMFKDGVPGFSTLTNKGVLAGIGGISALAGLMTPKEEEEEETLYAGADIADPRYIMNNPQLFTNRRLAAEGGDIEKEPVAKKVMPLLDMDGKEKDYRETGGFVDMGRMEKADDVPARLSKNEFVFTADAVRNAGDGSVDKGAEVMYNMMKNLEAGGDVSEESQGLEGARKMFQTSQRLEEVL
jgi:hypothetical protein